jgi:hypothetical protein
MTPAVTPVNHRIQLVGKKEGDNDIKRAGKKIFEPDCT